MTALACSNFTGACTEIGCSNGLRVRLEGAPPGPWTVEVRSGGTTLSQDCPAGSNCGGGAFFENFVPSTVSITVTRGGTSATFNNLTPTPATTQPNGPRCAPTCQQPLVTVQPPAP